MAVGCKGLLKDFAIADVEVAFWESLFTRSSGPQLYNYVPSDHATATVRSPLTPALGLQIAARATPHREGTGGVFICEGGESKRVFLLTARHVVIPPDAEHNQLYAHTKSSEPRQDVLLDRKAFKDVLGSIEDRIVSIAWFATSEIGLSAWGTRRTRLRSGRKSKVYCKRQRKTSRSYTSSKMRSRRTGAQRTSVSWATSPTRLLFLLVLAPNALLKTGLSSSSTTRSSTGIPSRGTLLI